MNKDIPITCGCFLIYNGQMLIVHSTGFNWDTWGIPKGLYEDNETFEDTMFREVYEETNIVIADYKHYLFDLGFEFYIHKRKKLHAFVVILQEWDYPNIYCSSTFNREGLIYPEVDAFEWLPINEALKKIQIEQIMVFERGRYKITKYL